MTFVDYETATMLKQQGFPQPKPATFQVWYGLIINQQEPIVLLENTKHYFWDKYGKGHQQSAFNLLGVFAPTATDILPLLDNPKIEHQSGMYCLKIDYPLPQKYESESLLDCAVRAWFFNQD